MKKNAKYLRLGVIAIAILVTLFGGLTKGNGTGGLILAGGMALLGLPYLISDWVLPKIKRNREIKRLFTGPVSPQPETRQPAPAPRRPEPAPAPRQPEPSPRQPEPAPQSAPRQPAPQPAPRQSEPAPQPAHRQPASAPQPAPRQPNPAPKPQTAPVDPPKKVCLYSEGVHGDQLEIVRRNGVFMVCAWNDGFPNRMGGGGVEMKLPAALAQDFDGERFSYWIRGNTWLKQITPEKMRWREAEVRQFLGAYGTETRWRPNHFDSYYSYYCDGSRIFISHRPQDRMSNDPKEGYIYTREQLARINKSDFVDWFGGRWGYDADRRSLAAWLDDAGMVFQQGFQPTPPELAPQNMG